MKNQILEQVKNAIRNPYAWPSGYPVYIVMADGELFCRECARSEYKLIADSTRTDRKDGWTASGTMILWEGTDNYCAHCNRELESAYGEPEAD